LRIGKVQILGNDGLIKEQIKSEESSKNAFYYSLQNLLSCRRLFENVNITIQKKRQHCLLFWMGENLVSCTGRRI